MRDENGYEILTYRRSWVFRLGWIGDPEGRTWATELKHEERFPTREQAQAAMEAHPAVRKDARGNYRTTYDNGQCGVFCHTALIEGETK